jgi:carboxyl-terminal processing protease
VNFNLRDIPVAINGAVFLASEFLSDGVVVEQEYSSGKKDYYRVNRKGSLLDMPLVVLVNQGSASAAEILAGALQYYKRGILVGEKTFGKGTVQEPQELPGNAGLHITISRWLLPRADYCHKELHTNVLVETDQTTEEEKDIMLEKQKKKL